MAAPTIRPLANCQIADTYRCGTIAIPAANGPVADSLGTMKPAPPNSQSFLSWSGPCSRPSPPRARTIDLSATRSFRSFGFPDRTHDQSVAWNPGGIPAFQGRTTYRAFVTADLPGRGNGFDAAINRAAGAGPVVGFWHQRNMRPGGGFCQGGGRATTIGCNVQYYCPRFLYLPAKPYRLTAFD